MALGVWWSVETGVTVVIQTTTPTRAPTATPTLSPTVTPTPPPPALPPTPTGTRAVRYEVNEAATAQAGAEVTAQAVAWGQAVAKMRAGGPRFTRRSRLVLAHYFAWFNDQSWHECNMSAGDRPLVPYHSDDPAAIARHVQMAGEIGLDGFMLHWFEPGNATDKNFATLLAQSEGHSFYSTVVFSRHIWGAPTRQNVAQALAYILDSYSSHPNFLHFEGKPVIIFTDVYRTPGGPTPQEFWADVRAEVDPERRTLWIAEGLDTSYLEVFDGLYVFKITHAAYPNDYQKSTTWAERVRHWAEQHHEPKLWVATISPGWDDTRAGCIPDVRAPAALHRRDRESGAFYRATYEAALESHPDWLFVGSFNEWVEGSYIEPGVLYGDDYLRLTGELISDFKRR
jgi:hypothetical protein